MDDHRSEIFWHISSIEKKDDRLPILPCANDRASAICKENCIDGEWLIYPRDEERAVCLFRAMRVEWIRQIIDLFNYHDERVKYWEKVNSNKKNRIYLRYQEEDEYHPSGRSRCRENLCSKASRLLPDG